MSYSFEHTTCPEFTWDAAALFQKLANVRYRQGKLMGRMETIGIKLRAEAMLRTLTCEVLTSTGKPDRHLNPLQVRASIAKRLGVNGGAVYHLDRDIDRIIGLLIDATQNYNKPLEAKRLFEWHAALCPLGQGRTEAVTPGWWDGTPDASNISIEMKRFLDWYNRAPETDPVIKAAIAHLWFVTVHPFENGNGRIACAIADMTLARSENNAQRFFSMSCQIRQERSGYSDIIQASQKGNMDITAWLGWFLDCLDRAFDSAELLLASVFENARFWNTHSTTALNERQRDILNKLFSGFDGKLTTSTYAELEACGQDTAYRDINRLIELGALKKNAAGGRSTSYSLVVG